MKLVRMASKLAVLLVALAAVNAWADVTSEHIPLYRTVSDNYPAVVIQGAPRYIESVDVNWQGANYRNVTGHVYADGREVWSGMIPTYDPTFRATVRETVSTVELRVDSGSAYVNWARVYGQTSVSGGSGCRRGCSPDLVGSLSDAGDLAAQAIQVISELQQSSDFATIQTHLMPIKIAAARVFSISKSSSGMHQIDVYNAVYGLELVFRAQEPFLTGLMQVNADFYPIMTLMTIRERYRALFGSTQYP